jgi:NADP-dependent 3-hydroxy acid dehydrogenase YdfG
MLVVAVARRKERLEELHQRIVGELGVPSEDFLPVVCDITKDTEVCVT